ncbi:MAG: 50S ribosomal protein L25 [Candidatus Giovannonibacteria bacterium]|nr:MAG: 50S ribosomal protein L25 [Candidatus Giovannonibacteria bacterium]
MQSITAEKRDILGKKVKILRSKGFLPAVVYSGGKAAEPISVKESDFNRTWRFAGESTVIELVLGGHKRNVLIHDVAIDPLKDTPVHADFYAVDMHKKIRVDVPLEFVGESEAVKAGGVLVKVLHSLKIEALPNDLPHSISVDISAIKTIGNSILISDLKIPAAVSLLDSRSETVAVVEAPRAEEEPKAAETAAEPSLESIEVLSKKPKAEAEEGVAGKAAPKNE